ncbi:hypothetical protein LTR94_034478, partial [Friedmanniomyces endolithicus]
HPRQFRVRLLRRSRRLPVVRHQGRACASRPRHRPLPAPCAGGRRAQRDAFGGGHRAGTGWRAVAGDHRRRGALRSGHRPAPRL